MNSASILDDPIPSQPSSKEVEQMFESSPQISESFPFGILNDLSIDDSLDLPEIRQQSHQQPIFKSLCSNGPRFLDQRNQDKFLNCFKDDQFYLTKPQVQRGGFVTAKPQRADQYQTLVKQSSFEQFPFSLSNDDCCRVPVQDHFAAGNDNTQHCSQIDCYSDFDIQEFVKPQPELSNLEACDVDDSPVFKNENMLLSLISDAKSAQAASAKPEFETGGSLVLPEPQEESLVEQQAPLAHEMTKQTQVHSKSSNMNVEELVKKLVRPFRRALKMIFDEKYKRKHYHWVDANVQTKTFEFFQNLVDAPEISTMIANNKGAFFYLIHLQFENKKSKDSTRGEMQPMDFDTTCYKELFGQKPNKRNLMTFFSQPEIQLLWQHVYIKHRFYKAWKNRLSAFSDKDQAKVKAYLQGIAEAAGFDMLR